MEVLKVDDLSKGFGGLQVLQNISFYLEAGEKVGLIGPNGAGKTTLLNVLSGLLPPTAGRIPIFGQDITKLAPHRRVFLGVARSFQLNALFSSSTLLKNIVLAVQGIKSSHFRMFRPISAYDHLFAEARRLLETIGLWGKKDVPVTALSYGEQTQFP